MAQRHHVYRHDPIEEALCELRFEPSTEWDLTFPGCFYEQVKEEYPGKPRQQNVMEAGFQALTDTDSPTFQLRGTFGKVQFPSKDARKLVAVGPDILSVHVLRPYPSWEDFFPRIGKACEKYQEVAQPAGVRSISLRYINRVQIKADSVDLDDYFTTAPRIPSA
jgi:uncharacterized protein (TIGR04255 family)